MGLLHDNHSDSSPVSPSTSFLSPRCRCRRWREVVCGWRVSTTTVPRAGWEFLLITVLFMAYKVGRVAVQGHTDTAFDNAYQVWNLERDLRFPSETYCQDVVITSGFAILIANVYYAFIHFPATAVFLLWVYYRRPEYYRWVRRSLVAVTVGGLAGHMLYPLAPPRMLSYANMVDTAQVYGPSVYGSPEADTLSNQYAAMPSLHVGWAVIVAVGIVASTHSQWRWLWFLHPVATVVVVIVTANHYWLDALVAIALLIVAFAFFVPPAVSRRRW